MSTYSNRAMRRRPGALLAPSLATGLLVSALVACDAPRAGHSDQGVGQATPGPEQVTAAATGPDGDREAPLWRAAFVVVDGVYDTELVAPYDVLEHTAYQQGAGGGIEVITVSPDGGSIRTAEGLRLETDYGFDDAPPFDILIVPSAEGSRDADLENERLISFVRDRGSEARLVVSLCWGSFVLAESGLLNGHAVTTFPGDYDRFARRFPDLDLRVNVSFVHDGRFLTSQGGVLSYDVAMYLVDLVLGTDVATGVGRGLLIPWPRSTAVEPPPFVSDTAFRLSAPSRR